MPSRSPLPARRMETKQSFFPSSIGDCMDSRRRLDGHRFGFKIAGHLVGEQMADLAQELAELRRRGVGPTHEGQLVLDQGVIGDPYGLVHI